MTANFDDSSVSLLVRCRNCSRSVMCSTWKMCVTGPVSDRIVRQASVRIRKLVKNGATTSTSMTFFQRPAFWAM